MTSINSSIEKLTVDPDYRHDRGHHHVYLDCQIVCRLFYKETNIFFYFKWIKRNYLKSRYYKRFENHKKFWKIKKIVRLNIYFYVSIFKWIYIFVFFRFTFEMENYISLSLFRPLLPAPPPPRDFFELFSRFDFCSVLSLLIKSSSDIATRSSDMFFFLFPYQPSRIGTNGNFFELQVTKRGRRSAEK